ncbi:hypothetical protein CPB83DRAFT_908630 [Crepidotus variabilis]|uniref:DUF8191 domain-containing protein n=1 Tax=Crepidotus variabilis TaxID=179855 RepID=A0A9P6EC51_9AGAR|nr:hypothetical protein CPB83DRAFT_908630 [Crepidotus variabilis]
MENQTEKLKAKIKHQAKELKNKNKEIARLKRAIQTLVDESTFCSESDYENADTDEEEDQYSDGSDDIEILDDNTATGSASLYDGEFYRCMVCGFEVIEGECAACGKLHKHSEANHVSAALRSIGIENQAIHPDRSLVPRGTTPLLEFNSEDEALPSEYHSDSFPYARTEEYEQLRRRGATRLMCETFGLSFDFKDGIFAWADDDLFQEFSSPKMKTGDTWKIHLGRRIELEEDDFDGSAFMEGLLEDAIYFPLRDPFSTRDFEVWDTVKESPGVWVTKMKAHRPSEEEDYTPVQGRCFVFDPASDDSDRWDCADVVVDHENRFLVDPPEHDGPLRANEYEIENDREEQMTEELMDFYPDFTHHDSVWAGVEEHEDDGNEGAASPTSKSLENEDQDQAIEDDTTDDSFDSDFNSDEDMTGDERERQNLDGAVGS